MSSSTDDGNEKYAADLEATRSFLILFGRDGGGKGKGGGGGVKPNNNKKSKKGRRKFPPPNICTTPIWGRAMMNKTSLTRWHRGRSGGKGIPW